MNVEVTIAEPLIEIELEEEDKEEKSVCARLLLTQEQVPTFILHSDRFS